MEVTAASATLARSIVRDCSRQTYFTARLLVDRDLEDDFHRGYAYFRWADDVVDLAARSHDECIAFIDRQRDLIDASYRGERPADLTPEEEMVADLIGHDRGKDSGLQSFIRKFLAVIEFDARRRGRPITEEELAWYSDHMGRSVTDGIQYFIANGHPYPSSDGKYLAATAAHVTHMLRDLIADVPEGFGNVPREYLAAHGIDYDGIRGPEVTAWVRERVDLARHYFREGKRYLDGLDVLRCKIAGYWYCTRFEVVLDAIESDGYVLRAEYAERRSLPTWFKIARQALSLALRHIFRRRG